MAYYNANNYIYPKIDLIGLSRGTIINLKYATEYPDRIDSMFALGGLFNGSGIARVAYNLDVQDEIAEFIGSFFTSDFVAKMADNDYTND